MVEKAYIEKVIDKYSYTIRIPKYNSILSSSIATSPDKLYTAYVCALPGEEPRYVIGDLVWVTFEHDYIDKPIILGKLYNSNTSTSRTYINNNTDFYFNINEYSTKISALMQEIKHCLHFEMKREINANNQYQTGIILCNSQSKNLPINCSQGILIILPFNSEQNDNNDQCTQLFISVENLNEINSNTKIYCRVSYNNGWKNWEMLHS